MAINNKSTSVIAEGEIVRVGEKNKDEQKPQKKINFKDESYLRLTELVDNSQILFKATTIFPFVFFPDDIIIDRDKVSLVSRVFFGSASHHSVLIKNISDANVQTSIFFGTLNIIDKYYADNSISVSYLRKKDAIKGRSVIQGLMICHEKKIDISHMNRGELLIYLDEIGKATAT